MNETSLKRSVPPPAGELVANKYEVVRLIGQGGMGSVWEGRHVTLGTRVACKFIDADFASKSPEALSRFRNEAQAAASLRSKYVVDVHDYGLMSDGRPYIVMEYLEGESLAQRLERVGRIPLAATARIIGQVGRALHKAHALGIIHRDLKPDNIFLMWDDEDAQDHVKVVDFGIAKFTDASADTSHATQTGAVLGTPFFMSPEQARGTGGLDSRSDLWSLGVVAFECLTGELPFYSEAVGELLIRICTGPIPVPSHVAPDLPLAIDAWMARALERDRDVRFQSSREMTDALAQVLGPSARPIMGSTHDEETGAARIERHLTAGPRAGLVVTDATTVRPRRSSTDGSATLVEDTLRPPVANASANPNVRSRLVWLGTLAAVGFAIAVAILLANRRPSGSVVAQARSENAARRPSELSAPPSAIAPAARPPGPERAPTAVAAPTQAAPIQAAPIQAAPTQAAPIQAAPIPPHAETRKKPAVAALARPTNTGKLPVDKPKPADLDVGLGY